MYRRTVFNDPILTDCEDTPRQVSAVPSAELVEFNGEPDHIHLDVSYPPTLAISTHVRRLKGASARRIRQDQTARCNRARMHGHFWTPLPTSRSQHAAPPLSIIKQYIENQATTPLRIPAQTRGTANPGPKSGACAARSMVISDDRLTQ